MQVLAPKTGGWSIIFLPRFVCTSLYENASKQVACATYRESKIGYPTYSSSHFPLLYTLPISPSLLFSLSSLTQLWVFLRSSTPWGFRVTTFSLPSCLRVRRCDCGRICPTCSKTKQNTILFVFQTICLRLVAQSQSPRRFASFAEKRCALFRNDRFVQKNNIWQYIRWYLIISADSV